MSKSNGYFLVARSTLDHWIWFHDPRFTWAQAWIDLIGLANHSDKQIVVGNRPRKIQRGQHYTSIRKLSQRWGWCKDAVSEFLNVIRSDGMIQFVTDANGTLITIENYGFYQDPWLNTQDASQDAKQDASQDVKSPRTKNKRIKEKNKREASPEAPLIRRGITYE